MAIFRGVGGSGDSSDNSFLDAVTAQANAASASASASSASASAASTSASNASTSASDAETAKSVAESSATTAVSQAIIAVSQAGIATSQAGIATTKASEAAASATAAQNLEITSASFDTADGTLTLTKANSGTVTTDLDGRYLTTHQDISGKANLSGATFTGDISFGDDVKAKFGDANDLLIYHSTTSGQKSVIEDVGTGGLDLITNGNAIRLITDDGEIMVKCDKDGGVVLNHNNYIKLQTTIDGIRVWDDAQFDTNINVDGNIAVSGTVDGVDVSGLSTTVAGKANLSGADFTGDVTTTGNVGIGTSSPTTALDVNGELAIRGGEGADDARMYFRASDNSNRFTIETDLDAITSNDILGFRSNSTDNILTLAGDGNVGIGTDNPLHKVDIAGDESTAYDATSDTGQSNHDATLQIFNKNATDESFASLVFRNRTSNVGVSRISSISKGSGTTDMSFVTEHSNTKSEKLRITSQGNVGINTGTNTISEKLDVVGNIAVSGTVDGRDVATDGTKLDGITSEASASHNYTTQLYQGYLNLTTSVNQVGPDFYLRNYSDNHYKRFAEVTGSVSYVGLTSTNDLNLRTILVVPSGSGSGVDIGSVDSITTTGTYNRDIVIVGDVSHWFSEYSGTALTANGTSTFSSIVSAIYNPTTNKTTINAGTYGITPPSVGDSIYVHPFDWESAGTEIYGVIKQLDADNESSMAYEIYNKVYFGNIDRVATCRIKLYEAASSDSVIVQRLRVYQSDERA